jgi:hypothetical protein
VLGLAHEKITYTNLFMQLSCAREGAMEASHQFWNDVVQWSKNLDFLDRMFDIWIMHLPKIMNGQTVDNYSQMWRMPFNGKELRGMVSRINEDGQYSLSVSTRELPKEEFKPVVSALIRNLHTRLIAQAVIPEDCAWKEESTIGKDGIQSVKFTHKSKDDWVITTSHSFQAEGILFTATLSQTCSKCNKPKSYNGITPRC